MIWARILNYIYKKCWRISRNEVEECYWTNAQSAIGSSNPAFSRAPSLVQLIGRKSRVSFRVIVCGNAVCPSSHLNTRAFPIDYLKFEITILKNYCSETTMYRITKSTLICAIGYIIFSFWWKIFLQNRIASNLREYRSNLTDCFEGYSKLNCRLNFCWALPTCWGFAGLMLLLVPSVLARMEYEIC